MPKEMSAVIYYTFKIEGKPYVVAVKKDDRKLKDITAFEGLKNLDMRVDEASARLKLINLIEDNQL